MNAVPDKSAVADDEENLISDDRDIEFASHSLKAMAHPLRLKILCLLGRTTEVSVHEIVEYVGTSQSNISQHLSILREKGILASRREANKVFYRIGEPGILELISVMRNAFCSRPA
jgi:ArsR family transcriptional regulator